MKSTTQGLNVVQQIHHLERNKSFQEYTEFCHKFIESWDDNFSNSINCSANAVVASNATVHETAILGPGVVVCDGALIGPNCYLKSRTIVGPNVILGFNVETDRLIILGDAKIAHAACVGRSIIGTASNLGYGFVNATRHLKGKPIRAWTAKDTYWNSNAKHHGCVIGSKVQAAVNVATMPGSTVPHETILLPSSIVKHYHA